MSTSASPLFSRSIRTYAFLSLAALTGVLLFTAPAFAGALDCGQPKSTGNTPLTADALHTLRTAVQLASCELCVCDVNDDETVNATDALLTLRKAVGLNVTLHCPACIGTVVFVSSATYQANLGGLAGADAKCQALATAEGLPGAFQAWLSDSTENAGMRVAGSAGPFALVDGTVVADSVADLTDGLLDAPISLDEKGEATDTLRTWTGTEDSGVACFDGTNEGCESLVPASQRTNCDDWTSSGGGGEGVVGEPTNADLWTLEGTRACTDQQRLYCMEKLPCEAADDCAPIELACVARACSPDGFCHGVFASTGTPCAVAGEPLKNVCAPPDSDAAGSCVECNEHSECTVVPEGALGVGCIDHVCQGIEHGSRVFSFTGTPQDFEVLPGITSLTITLYGAQGGRDGGRGARVTATIGVLPGDDLLVFVGGTADSSPGFADRTGGYNGGGNGGLSLALGDHGGGGGGASDVRQFGNDLSNRILVAGGGGGSWSRQASSGGFGGGDFGGPGTGAPDFQGRGGGITSGGLGGGEVCLGENGSSGQGGGGASQSGNTVCSTVGGGGGGGGYYGGGGGGAEGQDLAIQAGGGGGGSSWASPAATAVTFEPGVGEGHGEVTIEW